MIYLPGVQTCSWCIRQRMAAAPSAAFSLVASSNALSSSLHHRRRCPALLYFIMHGFAGNNRRYQSHTKGQCISPTGNSDYGGLHRDIIATVTCGACKCCSDSASDVLGSAASILYQGHLHQSCWLAVLLVKRIQSGFCRSKMLPLQKADYLQQDRV